MNVAGWAGAAAFCAADGRRLLLIPAFTQQFHFLLESVSHTSMCISVGITCAAKHLVWGR